MRIFLILTVLLVSFTGSESLRADSSCSGSTLGCNSCSISCPTGQAAVCSNGQAVFNGSLFVCQQQPHCICQRSRVMKGGDFLRRENSGFGK